LVEKTVVLRVETGVASFASDKGGALPVVRASDAPAAG